jgi:hypothetical protein
VKLTAAFSGRLDLLVDVNRPFTPTIELTIKTSISNKTGITKTVAPGPKLAPKSNLKIINTPTSGITTATGINTIEANKYITIPVDFVMPFKAIFSLNFLYINRNDLMYIKRFIPMTRIKPIFITPNYK